ncbi:methylmalonyl Co-A mutase-associated GTPase MeaB [Cohaesibacter celericrescens]|uniref:Methylmalonyl Co-A mutase-associated GTPase MeaB n=1 Tax=Cohaesibacter celericrescens TaxID=2067669 RepID=A0A2N5XRE9_9HYPH|nr:methylmalonyl Co-A mutase-associated GTPase MeaB [Cohaesibacter celericrescens]PLW77017.1 methylmalonyl Co-A mutase-associated GTPase MeaB [Cohaesibacter celericrescens]
MAPAKLNAETLATQIREGNRASLARAITLIESRKPEHRLIAHDLLTILLPYTGKAHRVGITGVPGVGKSTTIDQLGTNLTATGKKVAVLAVDPSSTRTGGSILGDKTRMELLCGDPNAFIRPSPSAGTLGGVAARTRETMFLCEAAGYDVILVETVGIGQSETTVADMVDFFLVLMLPGAGDELQGIKKGVLEIADMIAVNKADGDGWARARKAAAQYRAALHIMRPASPNWSPPVMTVSGLANESLDKMWKQVVIHQEKLTATGELQAKRSGQQVRWMWSMLEDRMKALLRENESVTSLLEQVESAVESGSMPASVAVQDIMDSLLNSLKNG